MVADIGNVNHNALSVSVHEMKRPDRAQHSNSAIKRHFKMKIDGRMSGRTKNGPDMTNVKRDS